MPDLPMPSFSDPTDPGTVWIWEPESKTYIKAPDNGLGPDRGHSTGGDNDLFNQNQLEHSELAGVPELEGHMAAMHGFTGNTVVNCPLCQESTDLRACPTCGKDLTPEWNKKDDEFVYNDPAPQEHHLDGMPEREPKRNRMKTDDSYPSMNLATWKMAQKIASRTVTAEDWDAMFSGDANMKVEIGKWIIDKQGQMHFEHGVHAVHEKLAERNGLRYPQDCAALGSVYNDGTADVQRVFPGTQFNQESAQQQIEQAFGANITLHGPIGGAPSQGKGQVFQPVEIHGGTWIISPQQQGEVITGVAWVKERSNGEITPNAILVAEHLQPEDFMLWQKGVRAIITATGGMTSHAAVLATTEGIPVILDIKGEYNKVETGNYLKIEPNSHTITVMPGATADWSPGQKRDAWNQIMQYQHQRGGHINLKPEYFAHIDEELAWHKANAAPLDSCPECYSPMIRQASTSVCHTCGHTQQVTAAPLAIPALMGVGEALGIGGGAAAAGAEAGGMAGVGGMMTRALGQGAVQGVGRNIVSPGGQGGGGGAPGAAPLDPTDTSQIGLVSKTADTFGEEEDGWATKNDGTNSTDEASDSGIGGKKEQGDGPEQLKDVDGTGGGKSPDGPDKDINSHGDPEMQDKAMKAFHLNLPLVMEFADSDEPGTNNPILVALDSLLEEAFPGYKDGLDQEDGTSPLEEAISDEGSDDSDDSDEASDDEPKANEKKPKEASLWDYLASDDDDDDVTEHESDCHCDECDASRESIKEAGMAGVAPMQFAQPGAGQAAGVPVGQNPTCPMCGQSHIAGTPCPDASMQQQLAQQGNQVAPGTASGPIGPAIQPTKVVTKVGNWIAESDFHNDTDMPGSICPACGGPGVETGPGQNQCRQCGISFGQDDQAQAFNPYAESDEINEAYERGQPSYDEMFAHRGATDAEFAFYAAGEERVQEGGVGAAQQPHQLHHPDKGQSWVDDQGAQIEEGQEYEMKTGAFAIPDRIVVERVLPDKITYTVDSGDGVSYRHELTKQQVDTDGTTFTSAAPADQITDSGDGFQDQEAPPRPGMDGAPQQDDISDLDSKNSAVSDSEDEMVSLDTFTGAYAGDAPEDRTWLLEGTSTGGVDVDPGLMAKLAGKDYDPREQRAFIDEDGGEARNLDRLDLDGTHYVVDGTDDQFNW